MRNGHTESRHRDRRDAKKPSEITRDEYRTVSENAKTIEEGRAAVQSLAAMGLISFPRQRATPRKFSNETERKIAADRKAGFTLREIGQKYAMNKTQVKRIVDRTNP